MSDNFIVKGAKGLGHLVASQIPGSLVYAGLQRESKDVREERLILADNNPEALATYEPRSRIPSLVSYLTIDGTFQFLSDF